MGKKKLFLFVVEGAKREMDILDSLSRVFFAPKSEVIAISIPTEMNIYMLYKIMKEDGFETDIVEILRERVRDAEIALQGRRRDDFAEVYFFFDFDAHANNLHGLENASALKEMLGALNNETDLGKLYISYPMTEALRDRSSIDCRTLNSSCLCHRDDFLSYKENSAKNVNNNAIKDYGYPEWKDIIVHYAHRVSCLFRLNEFDRSQLVELADPESIFEKQMAVYNATEKVFVLSSFPEFIIDYSEEYWKSALGNRKKPFRPKDCLEQGRF